MTPVERHTLFERDVTVTTWSPIVIPIISVIVAFNVVALLAWFIVYRRNKRRAGLKRNIPLAAPGNFQVPEKYRTFAPSVPSSIPLATNKGSLSYLQLMHGLRLEEATMRASGLSMDSQLPSNPAIGRDGTGVLTSIPQMKGRKVSYPRVSGPSQNSLRPLTTHKPFLRFRRSFDTDTESIYSSASAPLEYHDHLFRTRPFILDPTSPPSAPTWIVPLLKQPPAVKLPPSQTDFCDLPRTLTAPPPASNIEESPMDSLTQLLEQIDPGRRGTSIETQSSASSDTSDPELLSFVQTRNTSYYYKVSSRRSWSAPDTLSPTASHPHPSITSHSSLSTVSDVTQPSSPSITVAPPNIQPRWVQDRKQAQTMDCHLAPRISESWTFRSGDAMQASRIAPELPTRSARCPVVV